MFDRLIPFIAAAVAFIDFVGALSEASKVQAKANTPLWQLYLIPEFSYEYLIRVVFMFVFAVSLYVFTMTIYYRKIPLSVLRTDLDITFNRDFSGVSFARSMVIRANIPNVTAYITSSQASSDYGYCKDVRMNAHCDGAKLDNFMEPIGNARSFEIIHSFGRALRHRWFMLLIPMYFLAKKYDDYPAFLRRNLTKRSQYWLYVDEFARDGAYMDFAARDYPQHNFIVKLTFESGKRPPALKIRRIALHGVTDVHFSEEANGQVSFRVDRLHRETIRIYWDELMTKEVSLLRPAATIRPNHATQGSSAPPPPHRDTEPRC